MYSDELSKTFAALADPTRRAILARLASGECSVGELAEPFIITKPGISKHIRVLERAGLIEQRRNAQWRICRLTPDPIKEVSEWAEQYREMWGKRLDRLENYVEEVYSKEKTNDRKQRTKQRKL